MLHERKCNYNTAVTRTARITNFLEICSSRAPVSFPISPFRLLTDPHIARAYIYIYKRLECVLDWHVHTLHSCESPPRESPSPREGDREKQRERERERERNGPAVGPSMHSRTRRPYGMRPRHGGVMRS